MKQTIGLYIHIPFCKSKCPYCDFFSGRGNKEEYEKYANLLKQKIKMWSEKAQNTSVGSVYFGGGTPSVLGAELLCDLLNKIKSCFEVDPKAEITVEVNPDSGKDLDFEKLSQAGFNRISVGLQSAAKGELKALGRIHSAADAQITVQRAKKAGICNISLDLMMGIPGQAKESLKKSIDFCASCGVEHISSYILKIEDETYFGKHREKLALPCDDETAELYLYAVEYLKKLGYEQYEISNFAKKGFEGRHNINYWKCGEYIGLGPSAHSFFDGKRFYYNRSMEDFAADKIIPDGSGGNKAEFIMLALRLSDGLIFEDYEQRFGEKLPESLIKKLKLFASSDYVIMNNERARLTPNGFLVSNSIISELISEL